jgi:hypothetical protein
MNKQIDELLKQSTYDVLGVPQVDHQKFAKLLIKECSDVAGCNAHVSGFELGDLIQQHFDIKK